MSNIDDGVYRGLDTVSATMFYSEHNTHSTTRRVTDKYRTGDEQT